MDHTFLLSWDCLGLEYIEDITQEEKQQLWSVLKGESVKQTIPLNYLLLRAKYNPQRNYEIYIVTATEGVTKEDFVEAFKNSPQGAAEIVRQHGSKVFSNKLDITNRVII